MTTKPKTPRPMTELQTCPRCGGQMKQGRVKKHSTFTEKRRDCPKCGHGDKVHVRIEVREEILKIIEVAKREKALQQLVRQRTLKRPQKKNTCNNES